MPAEIKRLPRIFKYGATEIPDPAPSENPERVLEILSVSYPQITNAALEGPKFEGGKMVFTVKVEAGEKG